MTPRLTRQQQRAETRQRLLDAAREVFADNGYHAASVEDVSERAGFSTGAVYSAFGSKEELFLALFERELSRHIEQIELAIRDRPNVDDRVRGAAEHWMAFVQREPQMVLLFCEFWAYAVREQDQASGVARHFADVRAALSRLIAAAASDLELELTMPVEQLAIVVDALADGIARHKLADPQAVPDDLFAQALGLVIGGSARPGGALH